MGPIIKAQIVKILDQYRLEIAIPSPTYRQSTSHVMISRGKSRFVNEVHVPNAERSSAESLAELQNAWDSRRRASRRLVRTPSVFLPAKRPFLHKEPFSRPRGSGQLFLPILRMEEFCQ